MSITLRPKWNNNNIKMTLIERLQISDIIRYSKKECRSKPVFFFRPIRLITTIILETIFLYAVYLYTSFDLFLMGIFCTAATLGINYYLSKFYFFNRWDNLLLKITKKNQFLCLPQRMLELNNKLNQLHDSDVVIQHLNLTDNLGMIRLTDILSNIKNNKNPVSVQLDGDTEELVSRVIECLNDFQLQKKMVTHVQISAMKNININLLENYI